MGMLSGLTKKITLGIFILVSLLGCKEDHYELDPKLLIEVESLSVSNFSSEHSIDILSNLPWEAEANTEWIVLAENSGDKGKGSITFTVAENEDEERTGMITVTTAESSKSIEIVQESGYSAEFYVKEGGTGEGTSWNDATSLVNALNLAASGNTIHIAAGTYIPSKTVTGGDPADDGDITFEIDKYLTLIGGYPANATEGAVSDPEHHKTVLSGKLSNGSETYHVVTVTAPKIEEEEVVLEGLTISHGNASSSSSPVTINGTDFRRDYGGGVTIGNARVEIINSEIVDNKSRKFVAGLYIFGESVVSVKGSKINNNSSDSNGGGIWANSSTVYIYDSEINANSGGTAPGVHAYPDATVYMYNSSIASNMGRSYGAAFYARENSRGILVNSLIAGNESTSTNGGGGVMMYNNCDVDIISSTITGNKIAGPGGGIYRRLGDNVVNIYNSIISGNQQKDDGPDVDAFETDAPEPGIKSSVTGSKAFDGNGNEVAGAEFNADTMLDGSYVPIGTDNPAIEYGMNVNSLKVLGDSFAPALEDPVSYDMNGKTRSGLTTMGALVE